MNHETLEVTVDGSAPRRRRGAQANWSHQGRKTCYVIADCIVKTGRGAGRYRKAYDDKKAEYLARDRSGPSECPFGQTHPGRNGGKPIKCGPAHPHAAAMRYAVKRLVRDMWIEWRRLAAESEASASDLREAHSNPAEVS